VHSSIKSKLLDKVISRASMHQPGDPLDANTTFGPLASSAQRNRVKKYIEQGLLSGAEAVLRGAIQESGGCNVSPTIFDHVDATMPIVREEIFGPVLSVQVFDTEDEAIDLANGTDYGLEATIWTRNMGRGRRLAQAIQAGVVSVRTSGDEDIDAGSMLGSEPRKASGFGCEIGLKWLESYSTLKLVNLWGG
jgi:acyl-CoA reductase-like NAD-dependent aldehyde dehydrogenase